MAAFAVIVLNTHFVVVVVVDVVLDDCIQCTVRVRVRTTTEL